MKKITVYLSMIPVLMLSVGCGKHFLDINTNPNQPSEGDPAEVMTAALVTSARIVASDYVYINGTQNYYGSSSNAATPGPVSTNNFTSNDFSSSWQDNYYQYIESNAAANNKWFLVAAAQTMKAFHFAMLVDTYNDVPYTEALQEQNGIFTPKYDKAQDVYNACISLLDSAVATFENTTLLSAYNPSTADVLFKGNQNQWAQFANSVKLRILLHEINVTSQQSTIQAEMQKIAADPNGCLGAGESAAVQPGYSVSSSANMSPLYATVGYTINGTYAFIGAVANSYFISKLNSYNDPRIGYFYNANAAGQVTGSAIGIGGNPTASYFGGDVNLQLQQNSGALTYPFNYTPKPTDNLPTQWGLLQSPAQPAFLISSWESEFLQAEAVQRGLLPGSAQALYEQAITDNFAWLNVFTDGNTANTNTGSWSSAYEAQAIANVGWAASAADPLGAILTQKYISECFTDPLESWTDYRRLGYPKDLPYTNNPSRIYAYPYRFIYPQVEYNTNADNVNAEGTITPVSPKIFWMP
jgi:hypothetical protein